MCGVLSKTVLPRRLPRVIETAYVVWGHLLESLVILIFPIRITQNHEADRKATLLEKCLLNVNDRWTVKDTWTYQVIIKVPVCSVAFSRESQDVFSL